MLGGLKPAEEPIAPRYTPHGVWRPSSLESNRWLNLAAWGLPPSVVVLYAWLVLGGIQWNLREPFVFVGDALFYLAQSKSTIDHGWWWFNPSIGAPIGLHAVAFAQNTNVDQAIVWILGLVTRDAMLAVNVAWLSMLGLSAVTATWGLRRLGVSRLSAGAAGVLFALTPFAFYRNIEHFNLVTYLLPFPATAALLLASSDREHPWRARDMAVPAAGCVILGFNYIYFAFFGAFVLVVGALVGAARTRSIAPLRWGALCLGAVVLATTVNLIPNELVWQQEGGKPYGATHTPFESEVYGLKIRHLVGPTEGHWFPPFRRWFALESEAGFPYENENKAARLGVVATAGFVGLIATLIFPVAGGRDDDRRRVQAAAVLTVAALLLGTVGGFGALFSLLISPEIRAYNRISPFIAFFALAGVAFWIDRFTRARPDRLRAGLWLVLLVVGMADQGSALGKVAAGRPAAGQEFREVAAFMRGVEAQLPDQAMVYQLPVRPYPADSGIERMRGYDHLRPYLTTHRLRWSYPILNRAQFIWQRAVEGVEEVDLPRFLAREGFSAILINRTGYADAGRRLEQLFRDAPAGATVMATNDTFVVLDLRPLRSAPVPR